MQPEVGSVFEGKVTGITKFGAFVDLGEGKTGMVHISEVASEYVNDINEYLTIGQDVKVKVLTVADDGKISLSIKRAQPRPQRTQQQAQPAFKNRDRAPAYSGTAQTAQKSSPSFDDMVTKFLQSSDEKMTALRKNGGGERRSSRKGSYSKQSQYYD